MEIFRPNDTYAGFAIRQPIEKFPALSHCGEALYVPAQFPGWYTNPGVFQFIYVARGTWSMRVNGRLFMVRMGEMSVTYPDEPHAVNDKSMGKTQCLWVGLDLSALGQAGQNLAVKITGKHLRVLRQTQELEPVLRGLFRQLVRRGPEFEQVVRVQTQLIVSLLGQLVETAPEEKPPRCRRRQPPVQTPLVEHASPMFSRDHPYSFEVSRSVEFMERQLDRRLATAEIAEVAGWSAPHLYSRFRKEVGMTPHAYHLNLRLIAAKDALLQPELTIVAVAHSFGFSSSQHFSAAFAKSFGLSPTAWRSHIR